METTLVTAHLLFMGDLQILFLNFENRILENSNMEDSSESFEMKGLGQIFMGFLTLINKSNQTDSKISMFCHILMK